jgi:TetR/AcrR family transcriptional regulator, transcriptional repressor of aconitase
MSSQTETRRAKRRQQIIDAALIVVSEYGVREATLTRIAAQVGVTHSALYAHFPTRKDILVAVLDALFERLSLTREQCHRDNALEHLREIGLAHTRLVAAGGDGLVFPLFEFIAAAQDEGLQDHLTRHELAVINDLADVARRGQADGVIKRTADPEQIAWMVVGRAWTEDVAALMGLSSGWNAARSTQMLELLLGSVAV